MSITTKGIKYGYGVQAAARATAVAAGVGLRVRDEGGVSFFKSGTAHVEAAIKDGKWAPQDYEEYAGIKRPNWSHPGLLSVAWLQAVIDPLMDKAGPDGSGNYTYTLKAAGCAPTATQYLSLIMRNELATTKDHRLTGAVAKTIKLSSSESDNKVKMDTEFVANAVNYAFDGSGGTYTLPADSFKLHSGLITGIVGGAALQCPEFDLNLDFGLQSIVDNAALPQEELLGKFNVTGTVRYPWVDDDVMNDFIASTSNTVYFGWGTTGVSGYISITVPVKYVAEPECDSDNDVRLRQVIPFRLAEVSGTSFSIVVKP